MDFGIRSKSDLFKRVTPALNCKVRELKETNIKKEDIWNFLLKTKWEKVEGLILSEMVDDILNLDNDKLFKYIEKSKKEYDNIVESEIELL